MNGNSKYGNILTMLLVVFIVAILGVIFYFAYDLLNTKKINDDAHTAIQEFDETTQNIKRETVASSTNTTATNQVSTPSEDEQKLLEELRKASNEIGSQQQTADKNKDVEKVYMDGFEMLGKIEIPKTKCEYPILESVKAKVLSMAIGVAYGPGLNEPGNTVLFGHNYRNGLFFSNNKNLANGDLIYITDKYGEKVTYEIYKIYQTEASDASYFTRETEGRREISLQTCTDDGARRIIIWAKEKI